MSNSPLIDLTKLSPNHSGQRNHTIDRITPHCIVGQLSCETIGDCFGFGVEASCNYGVGVDGRIVMCVEEKNRSWCSSSGTNDNRAVTIECASDNYHPYKFNQTVYEKLIELCVDICQRNCKDKLIWNPNKDWSLNYQPAKNEMVLTVHRWLANKACPGDWMYGKMSELANLVTKRLNDNTEYFDFYRVRKSWKNVKSQIGAFKKLSNAKNLCDTKRGYHVYDAKGHRMY